MGMVMCKICGEERAHWESGACLWEYCEKAADVIRDHPELSGPEALDIVCEVYGDVDQIAVIARRRAAR